MEGRTIMSTQTKAEACFYYYKELNEELLKRYNNNTLYILNKNDDAKKLCDLWHCMPIAS